MVNEKKATSLLPDIRSYKMQNNVSMKRGLSLGTGPDFYIGDIILSVVMLVQVLARAILLLKMMVFDNE